MLAVRSFLLLALAALFAVPTLARHDPLRPPLHEGHLARPSLHRPFERSPRAIPRARQTVAPPSAKLAASRRVVAQEEAARKVEWARRLVGAAGEDVGRRVERVRRAVGGARQAVTAEEEGQALHDILFRLIQLLAASSHTSSSSASTFYDGEALANFAVRPAPAAPSASPAPVPSGLSRAKRSLPIHRPPTPQELLPTLLSTLTRTISTPLSDVLPALPRAQGESIRALLDELGDEVAGVVEGALALSGGAGQLRLAPGVGESAEGREWVQELLELVRGNGTAA